jgi:UDP-N-acetylglucosamine acyltransferase
MQDTTSGEKGAGRIHPTAVIDPKAEIESDVVIGPYSVIGPNVRIGAGCRIGAHVVIDGWTTIGKANTIFTGAVVGSQAQDLKYSGGERRLIIGDNNTIREYATINTSTSEENATRIGSNNLLMAYTHVAHECKIRNGVVMANDSTLAGHVIVEDKVILGGLAAVHQFVRLGTMAIIGGCSKVTKDVLPYSMVDGHPALWQGVNSVGLRRNGIREDTRADIKRVFKILCRSNLNTSQALEKIRAEFNSRSEVNYLVEFIENSTRGICK